MYSRRTTKNTLILSMFFAAIVTGILMVKKPYLLNLLGVAPLRLSQTAQESPVGVVGTISNISGNEIVFSSFALLSDLANGSSGHATRYSPLTAVVGPHTVIEKVTPKDSALLAKEREAFVQNLMKLQEAGKLSTTTQLTPPDSSFSKELSIHDLTVGSTVTAYTTEDPAKTESFTATRIVLFEAANSSTTSPKR